jgi:hypothetical protein
LSSSITGTDPEAVLVLVSGRRHGQWWLLEPGMVMSWIRDYRFFGAPAHSHCFSQFAR